METDTKTKADNVNFGKKLLMATDNLKVFKTQTPGQYEVTLNGKPQVTQGFLLQLSAQEAYDLDLEELMFLPFQVGIKRQFKDETGLSSDLGQHEITISQYNVESVTASFMVFGLRDDNNFEVTSSEVDFDDYREIEQRYLKALTELVKDDERLEFAEPDKHNRTEEDILDLRLQAASYGIAYNPFGPFEFFAEIQAKTFGEFCLAAEQISYELDRQASKIALAEK